MSFIFTVVWACLGLASLAISAGCAGFYHAYTDENRGNPGKNTQINLVAAVVVLVALVAVWLAFPHWLGLLLLVAGGALTVKSYRSYRRGITAPSFPGAKLLR